MTPLQSILSVLERLWTFLLALFFGQTSQSKRMTTAKRLLDAYSTLSVDAILSPLSNIRFNHQILPASLGMPARSKGDFSKHAAGITSVFDKFRMEPQQIFEDEVRNAVVIHAKMIGTLAKGMGEWENECVMIIRFDTSGDEVVEVQEFVDSHKAKMMKEKMVPKDFEKS